MSRASEDPDQAVFVDGGEPSPACETSKGDSDSGARRTWLEKTWAIVDRMDLDPCRRCWPDGQPDHDADDTLIVREGTAKKRYHRPQQVVEVDDD